MRSGPDGAVSLGHARWTAPVTGDPRREREMPLESLTQGVRIGEYILEERIGQGGFAEVWRARHAQLADKIVAIKIPTNAEYIDQLRKEGVIEHELDSPQIIRVEGLDLDHDPPYLAMEYVEGEDLRKRILRESPIPPDKVLALSRGILEPLQTAHQAGFVHRDLKPENVLLPNGGGVKLGDFGLGKIVEKATSEGSLSQSLGTAGGTGIVGTLPYMSPEQKTPGAKVDHRTDIYAFGVVFFEMLTGRRPIGAEVPGELVDGLDPGLDEVYRRSCARLEKRFGSVEEVLGAIEGHWECVPGAPSGVEIRSPETGFRFAMDPFPVTNREYNAFLSWLYLSWRELPAERKLKKSPEEHTPAEWSSERVSERGDHPVVGVDWTDACAYARWRDKRLPTQEEWMIAAGWDEKATVRRKYPWGNTFDPRLCNCRATPNRLPEHSETTPVSLYPKGRSPSGCYDMVGNVLEWCADEAGRMRVLKGGSWKQRLFEAAEEVKVARDYRLPTYQRESDVGFRCCKDV